MAEVPGWYTGFVAEVVAHLPRDIGETTAMAWVQNPQALEACLRGLLVDEAAAPASAPAPIGGAFQRDKSQDGWRLIEDLTEPTTLSMDGLELVQVVGEEEGYILGDEMVERAMAIDVKLGQRHAEHLLDHQESIPEEFRRHSLIFPGTVWLGTDSNHHIPCLSWRQGKWVLEFGILEAGVDSGDRLIRPRT